MSFYVPHATNYKRAAIAGATAGALGAYYHGYKGSLTRMRPPINTNSFKPSEKISVSTVNRMANKKRTKRNRRKRYGVVKYRVPRVITSREKLIRAKVVDSFTSAGGAAGALETRLLSAMNIPDPTTGHTNQQFLGYDQWKEFYRKGVVLGVKITLRVWNKGSVGMMYGITSMPENQGNTTLTSHEHYMELPNTKARMLSPDVDNGVIVYKVGTRKHLHLKSLRDEDAFFNTLATETEATRTFWINMWFQPIDAATQCGYEAVATYEFIIRLFDPIVPARSTDT